jgi:hypothetical protein
MPLQRISVAADQIACRPEPHSRLTVYAGMFAGTPAVNATRRAL